VVKAAPSVRVSRLAAKGPWAAPSTYGRAEQGEARRRRQSGKPFPSRNEKHARGKPPSAAGEGIARNGGSDGAAGGARPIRSGRRRSVRGPSRQRGGGGTPRRGGRRPWPGCGGAVREREGQPTWRRGRGATPSALGPHPREPGPALTEHKDGARAHHGGGGSSAAPGAEPSGDCEGEATPPRTAASRCRDTLPRLPPATTNPAPSRGRGVQ